jgi:MoxR-like ATPase
MNGITRDAGTPAACNGAGPVASKGHTMSADTATSLDTMVVRAAEAAVDQVAKAREAIGQVVFGQTEVVENAMITVLSGGHGLVVGVPGLAKTKLVDTMGSVLGLEARRIQFTPDLMPSDILGSEVLEENSAGRRSFRFVKGPVFAQLLMADEINRASPRTQSALLQAMQEYHVTVAGESHDLPRPFHVLATQNPIEQEGTYPLPEAQLDRFLMQIDVGYPDAATERRILVETTSDADSRPKPAMTADDLMAAQRLVRRLPVGNAVVDAILGLVRAARPGEGGDAVAQPLAWGPGPRAGQALMLTVRARALLQGRLSPSLDDVAALAGPVLKHRMALTFAARAEGATIDSVISALVGRLG